MINEILNILLESSINRLIITNDVYEKIESIVFDNLRKNLEIEKFDDLRSATFYSLGRTNLKNEPIILMFNGQYLSNIYTAITEAWFQKRTVIAIALYNNYDEINSNYLENCIPNIINIYEEDISRYKEKIICASNQKSPCLINIKSQYNIEQEKIDYSNILKKLNNILNIQNKVFIYNSEVEEKKYNFSVSTINNKYKYGTLSKYMGYITGKNEKTILCATTDILKLDLNIFNNRYINQNLKIILYDNKNILKENTIEEWIEKNNIKVTCKKNINEENLKEFIDSNNPEIIVIGGEL